MTCYKPWSKSFRSTDSLSQRGSLYLPTSSSSHVVTLPCGKCIGCFADQARDWATRCYHEWKLHETSSFLTLTYEDQNLVYGSHGPTLFKTHVVKFLKRLRHHIPPVRYFLCGEYGSKTHRPHYHLLLFGHDFITDDPTTTRRKSSINTLMFESPILTCDWGLGSALIGDVSLQSIQYVTKYLLKQADASSRLRRAPQSPEHPEFRLMSRNPGLGTGWYDRFSDSDLYPHDNVVISGFPRKIPRFYSSKYRLTNPLDYASVINSRDVKPIVSRETLEAAEQSHFSRKALFSKDSL